ncbi:SigE family RNA polymerase sigma factor [Kitasatospora purpeofusca]|uniref:SigE family RNA polymerase sigma factor n=1 Tax=Kitasatospora purpeofusca TaxID=67352 RepID=UPI003865C1A7
MTTRPAGGMPVRESPSEREADFSRFAHAVHPAMLRTARLLTGDPYAAQDLAQSALLRIYMSWGRSDTWDNPQAYARRTLVNVHATWRRRHWYREIPHRSPREQGQTKDPAQRWGDLVDLERALAALPAAQRTVLVLRFYEDLSVEQVAQLLGCSVGTVKSRTSRALDRIRGRVELSGRARREQE